MLTSLEKRIKRHVQARMHDFFIIAAPGLESLCREELMRIPSFGGEAVEVPGGVSFSGNLYDMYLANLHLRTASRILMRIAAVTASHFTRLSAKAADIPWELYLHPGIVPVVHVTTHHCRLYHTEAIADIFLKSIHDRLSPFVTGEPSSETTPIPQHLFIRGVDDRFLVSMDSSGDLLYKRGVKTITGRAPVRETLAAAILMWAGYSGNEPLINPMCGSGTFAIEGAMIARNIPPGLHRSFAFMEWPAFRPTQWQQSRRSVESSVSVCPCPSVFAIDKSASVCNELSRLVKSQPDLQPIQIFEIDFFDLYPKDLTDNPGLVVINPPYGKRMGSRRESRMLIQNILKKLRADYRGWRFALMLPDRFDIDKVSPQWRFHGIVHGGLKMEVLVGKLNA